MLIDLDLTNWQIYVCIHIHTHKRDEDPLFNYCFRIPLSTNINIWRIDLADVGRLTPHLSARIHTTRHSRLVCLSLSLCYLEILEKPLDTTRPGTDNNQANPVLRGASPFDIISMVRAPAYDRMWPHYSSGAGCRGSGGGLYTFGKAKRGIQSVEGTSGNYICRI